jgi:hypothetical protein
VTEPQRWPFPIQHKPCPTCGKQLVPGHIHTCTPQPEKFCDDNCTWRDHHPDCAIGRLLALPDSEGGEV